MSEMRDRAGSWKGGRIQMKCSTCFSTLSRRKWMLYCTRPATRQVMMALRLCPSYNLGKRQTLSQALELSRPLTKYSWISKVVRHHLVSNSSTSLQKTAAEKDEYLLIKSRKHKRFEAQLSITKWDEGNLGRTPMRRKISSVVSWDFPAKQAHQAIIHTTALAAKKTSPSRQCI